MKQALLAERVNPELWMGMDFIQKPAASAVSSATASTTAFTVPAGMVALVAGIQVYNGTVSASNYFAYAVPSGSSQVAANICWSQASLAASTWSYANLAVWIAAGGSLQFTSSITSAASIYSWKVIYIPATAPISFVKASIASGGAATVYYTVPIGTSARQFYAEQDFESLYFWNTTSAGTATLKEYVNIPSLGTLQVGATTLAGLAGAKGPFFMPSLKGLSGSQPGWGLATTSASATVVNMWAGFLEYRG
jgi:hypothetical protein